VGKVLAEVESFLEQNRNRYSIQTLRSEYRKTFGQVQAFLEEAPDEPWWYVAYKDLRAHYGFPVDHTLDAKMVIKDMKDNLPSFVGVRMTVEGSGGGGGGDPSISVYLIGDDTEVLAGMVEEVERRLRQVPAIIGVDSDVARQDDEVRVRLNRERANALGISPNMVARTIAYGLQGANLPRFQTDEREVSVRMYMDARGRQHLNQLRNFTFRSSTGQEVPLSAFATRTWDVKVKTPAYGRSAY